MWGDSWDDDKKSEALSCGLPVCVGDRRAGHFHVVAAQEKQQSVECQANGVGDEDELDGAFGTEFEPFEETAAHEDANAGTGNCYRSWKPREEKYMSGSRYFCGERQRENKSKN